MSDATPSLRELDLEAHLRDPARKQRFVTPMFDVIAPRYDRFTRLFSFGMDARWKAELLALVEVAPGATALDLACGTGDLALLVAERHGAAVTGIDASERMVDGAERRRRRSPAAARVTVRVGDMLRLDVPDRSVDLITAGYALRNVPEHRRALAEIARVLRPGGLLLTLDFYRPERAPWRRLFLAYLAAAGNLVGWLWHREPVVYGYIARSIAHWLSWREFSAALDEAGLAIEQVRPKLLGAVAIHRARRVGERRGARTDADGRGRTAGAAAAERLSG